MGYAVGSNPELGGTSPDLLAQLSQVSSLCYAFHNFYKYYLKALGPASRKVYSDTSISRIYSVYAIVMLPGQTVPLHLDVPEFHGIDRSACPNWLLVSCNPNFHQIINLGRFWKKVYTKWHSGCRPLLWPFLLIKSEKRDCSVLPGHQDCWSSCCLSSKAGWPLTSSGKPIWCGMVASLSTNTFYHH